MINNLNKNKNRDKDRDKNNIRIKQGMLLLEELMLIYKNKYKIYKNLIIKIHIMYQKLMKKL